MSLMLQTPTNVPSGLGVPSVQHHKSVQAFAPNRANESVDESALSGALRPAVITCLSSSDGIRS